MKRKIFSLMLLVALVVGFSACKDDDDTPPGKFTHDGKTYDLARAFATLWDSWTSGDDTYYAWDLYLTSSGINYDETEEEFTGEGEAVLLTIYALNDDSFVPVGTYNSADDECWSDGVYVDFNVETGDGDEFEDFDSVTVTITKSGDTFTIEYTIEFTDGDTVTGSYKGSIKEIGD